MSRKLFYFCLAVLALSACAKESMKEILSCSKSEVTLCAKNVSTKTYLADEVYGEIWWSAGDSLSLFTSQASDGGSKFVTADGGFEAEFTGEAATASKYFGLYPYNKNNTFNGSNSFGAEIPVQQTAQKGGYDPSAMLSVGVSETLDMGFYIPCGGIRFSVYQQGIDKVVFKTNGGEKIAGNVTISVSDPTNPAISSSSGTSDSITLTATDGFLPGTTTFYYIPMIPKALSEGFTMTFYKGGEVLCTSKCTSYVVVGRGVFSTIKNADNPAGVAAIFDGIDVSQNGTANCYVISSKGCYKFPAVAGNRSTISDDTSVSPVSAEVVWETDNTATAVSEGAILQRVKYKNGYVYIQTASPIKNGNALVAVKDASGTILWSWHIWVCDGYSPDNTKQLYKGATKYFMDRNLGALSSTPGDYLANGFLYQWGRKDPFMGAAATSQNTRMASTHPATTVGVSSDTGTIKYSIENPNVFIYSSSGLYSWMTTYNNNLWAVSKSVYDPCPPGWRIPADSSDDDWKKAYDASAFTTDYSLKGVYATLSSGGKGWYPATGNLNCSKGELCNTGEFSICWSNTKSGTSNSTGFQMFLSRNNSYVTPCADSKVRAEGHAVRCVKE